MEQLCKDLTTTYDTNILDNQYPIVQQEFLKVSLASSLQKNHIYFW